MNPFISSGIIFIGMIFILWGVWYVCIRGTDDTNAVLKDTEDFQKNLNDYSEHNKIN